MADLDPVVLGILIAGFCEADGPPSSPMTRSSGLAAALEQRPGAPRSGDTGLPPSDTREAQIAAGSAPTPWDPERTEPDCGGPRFGG
jgi:hypothetical protein